MPGYSNDIFSVMIDPQSGNIYEIIGARNKSKVGIDNQKEQEYLKTIKDMQETLDNYYNKLVELGAITIPKTPEEIAREAAEEQLRITKETTEQLKLQASEQAKQQAEINQALLGALSALTSQLGGLNNGINGHSNELGRKQIGSDSEENREIPAGSTKSNANSKADSSTKSK